MSDSIGEPLRPAEAAGPAGPAPQTQPAPVAQPARRSGVGFGPVGLLALVAGGLGIGVGLLWRVVTPRVPIIKAEQGFLYALPQPEQAVAADGWFAFLGVGVGVIVAVAAWFGLRHRRGVAVLVALVLGSLVGAWFGWWLGIRLEMGQFEALAAAAPVGAQLDAPLSLRITDLDRDQLWPPKATGVIVAQALAAAVAYTILAGFATDPQLRANPPRPDEPGPVGRGDDAGALNAGPFGSGPLGSGPFGSGPLGSGPVGSGPVSSGPDAPGPQGSPGSP